VIGRKFDKHCRDVDRIENSGRRGAEGQAIARMKAHLIGAVGRMWCAASLGECRDSFEEDAAMQTSSSFTAGKTAAS
jgi:hypothetical protein